MLTIGYVQRKLAGLGAEVVSTVEMAKALGVDPSTIRRHIRRNKLKAYKVGGVYHIRLDEAANYLNRYWLC